MKEELPKEALFTLPLLCSLPLQLLDVILSFNVRFLIWTLLHFTML